MSHGFLALKRLYGVVFRTFTAFAADRVSQRGAALSFFAMFALPPLLVLLVMLLSLILDDAAIQARILHEVSQVGGETSVAVFRTILDNMHQPNNANGFALLISLAMLLFSATNVFAQLQDSLNAIWGVQVRPGIGFWPLIQARLLSFGLILALALVLILLVGLDIVLTVLQQTLAPQLGWLEEIHAFKYLSMGLSFFLLIGLMAAVFKILPDVEVSWQDVFIGSFFTALLLSLSKILISWYLLHSNMGSAYGAAGSTLLFLFWLYLNIQLFLLGAEFTESYAHEYGSAIRPSIHAVWLPGKEPQTELESSVAAPSESDQTGRA